MDYITLPNSVGLVTTTAGNDLVHTLSQNLGAQGGFRSAIITRVLAYNNTGGNVTLQFGTLSNTPAFVQYLPILVAINGIENIWDEGDLPMVYFSVVTTVPAVAANDRVGHIYVLASAAAVTLVCEIKEFGS